MSKKRSKKQHQTKQSVENLIKERARKLPLSKCYINSNWNDLRIAHVVISRKHSNNNLTYTVLLLDLALYGIKDAMYRFNAFPDDLEDIIDNDYMEFVEIPYEQAHNVVFSSLVWAEDYGFMPAKEWKTAQFILEEDTDDIPLVEIECGIEGKPAIFYDTAIAFQSDVEKLMKTAGEGNFSIFYEEAENDGYEPGVVEQIIDDDIEEFFPDYYNDDFDISSRIDDTFLDEDPAAQIPIINKIYFEVKGREKFESIDLIDYAIGNKEVDMGGPLTDQQLETIKNIDNKSKSIVYGELINCVKQFSDNWDVYNYLFAFLHNSGVGAETGEILSKAEDLFHTMDKNLFVTAFYLFELICQEQDEKYREVLSQTDFFQKVRNYPGDIPKVIFIYYCCIRSLEELRRNDLEEADIYYFASRIFTSDNFEHTCVGLVSIKLAMIKVEEIEGMDTNTDSNHLRIVHNNM